jgi:transcription elongation factor Elf1
MKTLQNDQQPAPDRRRRAGRVNVTIHIPRIPRVACPACGSKDVRLVKTLTRDRFGTLQNRTCRGCGQLIRVSICQPLAESEKE